MAGQVVNFLPTFNKNLRSLKRAIPIALLLTLPVMSPAQDRVIDSLQQIVALH